MPRIRKLRHRRSMYLCKCKFAFTVQNLHTYKCSIKQFLLLTSFILGVQYILSCFHISTVRTPDPFYIKVTYHMKWVKTFWPYSRSTKVGHKMHRELIMKMDQSSWTPGSGTKSDLHLQFDTNYFSNTCSIQAWVGCLCISVTQGIKRTRLNLKSR